METPFWGPIPSPEAGYEQFVEGLARAVQEMTPGDFWQVLGACPKCGAALGQFGLSAHISSLPKLPPLMQQLLFELKKRIERGNDRCPTCDEPLDFTSVTRCYMGRVAPLVFASLVLVADRQGSEWVDATLFVFRPPGEWVDLGKQPTSNQIVRAWGRAMHPASCAIGLVKSLSDGEARPVRWISGEAVLTFLLPTDPPDGQTVAAAALEAGLRPPFHLLMGDGEGAAPAVLEAVGAGKIWEQLKPPAGTRLVYAYSEPSMRERLAYWARVTFTSIHVDASGDVKFTSGGQSHETSLEQLSQEACGRGFTFDEVLYTMGFDGVPLPGRETAPHSVPTVSEKALHARPPAVRPPASPAAPRPRVVSPAEGQAPVYPVARGGQPRVPRPASHPPAQAPVAAPAVPAAAGGSPWSTCRVCGRSAILVRRLYDATRVSNLFKPLPVICEKALNVRVFLMQSCGMHLEPVAPGMLQAWRLPEVQAIGEAARELAQDQLTVRRRISADADGRPVLGLVGELAGSIASDPRWMEAAMRQAACNIMGVIRVEVVGENVITFRSKERTFLGPTGKELRKIAKTWGLFEPRIAMTWTRDFQRHYDPVGGVLIAGDV